MFPICLLFFFFPLQRKFILRRDDDRIKDIFIITWRSVGEHYCQTNCEPRGQSPCDEAKTQRCDKEAKKPCSFARMLWVSRPENRKQTAWCRLLSCHVVSESRPWLGAGAGTEAGDAERSKQWRANQGRGQRLITLT